MKLLLISLLVLFGNVKSQSDHDVEEFLKLITEMLEAAAKLVHLDPDANLSIIEILEKYGYPVEEHNVTTEDDYILTMHRIQAGKEIVTDKSKPVVFMVHGLGGSAMQYVNPGPNKALGMLFADAGYDVWLANTRGTVYTSHKTLTQKDSDFWEFSFHEKAIRDLPASIDYVLDKTKQEKITYVGHSEGTTEALILTSTIPEYNKKINLIILLSPVAYMGNITSPLPRMLVEHMDILQTIFNLLNIKGQPFSPLLAALGKVICNDESNLQGVCVAVLEFIMGFDIYQFNKTYMPVLLNSMPAGSSLKELYHYGQEIKSGYFRQYDYGTIENLLKYGSATPPSYDVKKITCPVASYYGKNDFFAAISDVEKLLHELPNKALSHLMEYEFFNHLDFVFSNDMKEMVFDIIIDVVKKYNPLN